MAILRYATTFYKESILRFQKSLTELKNPNNIKSTKIFVKVQLYLLIF